MDLLAVLGKPEGKASKKAGSSYLDSKPAELRTYLEQAVDVDASPESRAEALCRAIQFTGAEVEEDASEVESDDLPMDSGEDTDY